MNREIRWAVETDRAAIWHIDKEVVGKLPGRSEQIARAIEKQLCKVILSNSKIVGFMIWNASSFRGSDFLALLVVDASNRRQGLASALLNDFRDMSERGIVWTSTNTSNAGMRSLLKKSKWVESDYSEDVDPGDPDIFYFLQREEN